jgi:hypothetical protein
MDRIQGFIVLILMAFLADGIHFQRKLALGLYLEVGVREGGYVCVTLHACNALMGRGAKMA